MHMDTYRDRIIELLYRLRYRVGLKTLPFDVGRLILGISEGIDGPLKYSEQHGLGYAACALVSNAHPSSDSADWLGLCLVHLLGVTEPTDTCRDDGPHYANIEAVTKDKLIADVRLAMAGCAYKSARNAAI